MNYQKEIEAVFKEMAPCIASLLTESMGRGVYDGAFSLGVRLKNFDEDVEPYPVAETEPDLDPSDVQVSATKKGVIVESPHPKQWFYRLPAPIELPFRPQISVSFRLGMDHSGIFRIEMTTILVDEYNWESHEDCVGKGQLTQLREQILGAKFPKKFAQLCLMRIWELSTKIEAENRHRMICKREEELDVIDFDAVMAHIQSLPEDKVKGLGRGILAVNILKCLLLIDTNAKKCIPLSDKNARVTFCSIDDIPADLLGRIRKADKSLANWDMESYSLSLSPFGKSGKAQLKWVISPYYYCPMDEDGFGEEECPEVAIACYINTKGQLAGAPEWV